MTCCLVEEKPPAIKLRLTMRCAGARVALPALGPFASLRRARPRLKDALANVAYVIREVAATQTIHPAARQEPLWETFRHLTAEASYDALSHYPASVRPLQRPAEWDLRVIQRPRRVSVCRRGRESKSNCLLF